MELVYLWVEDYQCLKDVEFNFGGEHIFHYEKGKDDKDGVLTSKPNPQYIEGFFNVDSDSNTKISNVTAIVGVNGAGKSTALRAIYEYTKITGPLIGMKHVYIYWNRALKEYLVMFMFMGDDNTITYKGKLDINKYYNLYSTEGKEKINYIPDAKKQLIKNLDLNEEDAGSSYIVYDNILDARLHQGLFNTNITSRNIYNTAGSINKYESKEVENQATLINQLDDYDFPFKKPEFLKINFMDSFLSSFYIPKESIDENLSSIRSFNDKIINEKFKTEIEEGLDNDNVRGCIAYTFFMNFVLNWYVSNIGGIIRVGTNIGIKQSIPKLIKNIVEIELNPFDNFTQFADKVFDIINDFRTDNVTIWFENTCAFVTFIQKLELDYPNETSPIIKIKKTEQIKDFFELYNKIIGPNISLPISFEWCVISNHNFYEPLRLSSGEQNYFKIFARFFSISEIIKNPPFLILFLDEPDNTLHPRWQRELLNELIKFLQTGLFNDDVQRNIQIIFTTNNPMMLSDIPKHNIVFLMKDGESGEIKVEKSEDMNETFGTNIHDLYKESFFLDNTLGSIVSHKANEILKLYHDVSSANISEDTIKLKELSKIYYTLDSNKKSQQDMFNHTVQILGDQFIANILQQNIKTIEMIFEGIE